mmetsp:Transcript_10774/g.22133  ORF Transcript_10774/g.22133 Transcript_10774/m.22133 type:complete len:143 (+) Transcript_10774:141-569(+)
MVAFISHDPCDHDRMCTTIHLWTCLGLPSPLHTSDYLWVVTDSLWGLLAWPFTGVSNKTWLLGASFGPTIVSGAIFSFGRSSVSLGSSLVSAADLFFWAFWLAKVWTKVEYLVDVDAVAEELLLECWFGGGAAMDKATAPGC